jgi:hypothetical protein
MKTKNKASETPSVEPHNFTHNGDKVLILRRCDKSRVSKNNFKYPSDVGSVVECPDWNSKKECGGGLHGWPWGFGLGQGADYDLGDVWLVIGAKPADVVGELENGWKCKFRTGVIRYDGTFAGALAMLRDGFHACVQEMAKQPTVAAAVKNSDGNSSQLAASGDSSQLAASGDSSQLAASGYYSQLAASGYSSQVDITGKNSVAAVAAIGGRAKMAEGGAFALAFYNSETGWDFVVGKVGVNGVKADIWYHVEDGKLVEG